MLCFLSFFFAVKKGGVAGMAKLTEKQRRFCDEYLIDLNATQAAIRAGYSAKTAKSIGQRLLTNVDMKNYIAEQLELIHSEKTADAAEVMEYLTSVMRGQSSSEEIVVEMCGDGVSEARTMEKAPSEKDRLKAAELLGKTFRMFTDNYQANVDAELNIHVDYGDEDECDDPGK